MIKFCSLSSGSKGNTAYVEINGDKFLLDIGNTTSYVEKALQEINVDPRDIKGIFISHSHHDHVDGLKVFIKRYNPIVYLSEESYYDLSKLFLITNYVLLKDASFPNFKLTLIPTSHDVLGSYGFVFDDGLKNIVYITDTGYISQKNLKLLGNKSLYYFESNHDIEMLMKGSYPYYLKQRILSDKGHLSNTVSAKILSKVVGNKTKYIYLAHISEHNNTKEIALETAKQYLKDTDFDVNNIIITVQGVSLDMVEI